MHQNASRNDRPTKYRSCCSQDKPTVYNAGRGYSLSFLQLDDCLRLWSMMDRAKERGRRRRQNKTQTQTKHVPICHNMTHAVDRTKDLQTYVRQTNAKYQTKSDEKKPKRLLKVKREEGGGIGGRGVYGNERNISLNEKSTLQSDTEIVYTRPTCERGEKRIENRG